MSKDLLYIILLIGAGGAWVYICMLFTGINPAIPKENKKELSAMGAFIDIMGRISNCSTPQYLPDLEDEADDFRAKYYITVSNDELETYYENILEEIERRRRQLQGHSILQAAM